MIPSMVWCHCLELCTKELQNFCTNCFYTNINTVKKKTVPWCDYKSRFKNCWATWRCRSQQGNAALKNGAGPHGPEGVLMERYSRTNVDTLTGTIRRGTLHLGSWRQDKYIQKEAMFFFIPLLRELRHPNTLLNKGLNLVPIFPSPRGIFSTSGAE